MFIKCREKKEDGKRRAFKFITSGGGLTRLRVHASPVDADKVDAVLQTFVADNPGWEFKAVAGWDEPYRGLPDASIDVVGVEDPSLSPETDA